jgi:ribosomal protein S4
VIFLDVFKALFPLCRYSLADVAANNRQYVVNGCIAVAPSVLQAMGQPVEATSAWSVDAEPDSRLKQRETKH